MTHHVEGQAGLEFCDELMDIDDSFAIKSAFQVIPVGVKRCGVAQLRASASGAAEWNSGRHS